jgi:hypothetical protein
MRHLTLCTIALVVFTGLGCLRQEQTPGPEHQAFYAGQWQATYGTSGQWTICFAPDGSLDSAVISLGNIRIRPKEVTHVTNRGNQTSTIKAGPCDVKYSPETRNLYTRIPLEDVHIVYENNVIDGNQVDQFMGIVSEDGKTWVADWINTFNYGPRFPQNVKNDHVKRLIFKRTMEVPIE